MEEEEVEIEMEASTSRRLLPDTRKRTRIKARPANPADFTMSGISKNSLVFILSLVSVLVLFGVCIDCVNGDIGGSIKIPVILDRTDSPYFIKQDVIIEETGELTIRPGVKLLFSPSVGITVFGRLIAEGTEDRRILMSTSMNTPLTMTNSKSGRLMKPNDNHYYSTVSNPMMSSTTEYFSPDTIINARMRRQVSGAGPDVIPDAPAVRLMEGPLPFAGRVQVYHRGHWRSVCTNSRNWTEIDINVVCRELGFTGGEYWPWMDHQNDTKQMLWERPHCLGLESHIKDCPNFTGRKLGSGVCDHHPNLAIRCDTFHRFPSQVEHHWRGLRFDNAQFRETYIYDNTLRIKESLSFLKYVDIFNAGVGYGYNTTSAIETSGVPPSMTNLRVENSAYNGINITNPTTVVTIHNSTFRNNAGFGIYVNSSASRFGIDNCLVDSNGADGILYVFNDFTPEQRLDGIETFDLCTVPITINQIYPLRLTVDQFQTALLAKDCRKRFTVRPGYVLTVHFPYMMSTVDNGAVIMIYDGPDSRSTLLTTITVKNETWPQSVTSMRDSLYIEYKAKPQAKLLLYMDIVAGRSKDYELLVSNSIVSNNNGRGIAVENIRSQVIVYKTVVKENTNLAGIHVLNGVGHVNISRSEIINNIGDGVNITYGGGCRNISRSTISSNSGRGIAIWFNETSEKLPGEQETVVEYTEISRNLDIGIFVGNFCASAIVNISGNLIRENNLKPGIEVWSCWLPGIKSKTFSTYSVYSSSYLMKLEIGHNQFISNEGIGLLLKPLVNTEALVEHNYFTKNSVKGCMAIESEDKKELESSPARVLVRENVLEYNSGLFAASLGLNHVSPKVQKLLFTQNFVRYNRIEDMTQLNPRSRVSAPIVIASPNIEVYRNVIQNLESKYEIGSHVQDQSFELNCTYNWLGSTEEREIYYRVFDRKDRFNLARIIYIPFLLNPTDPNTEIAMTMPLFVPPFDNPEKVIGGEITGRETLTNGEYKVVRDISVRPGGQLQISFGVTLKFLPSVGMLIGGQFHAEGYGHGDGQNVKFTLFEMGRMNATDSAVRLVGGRTRKEGRLQVRIDNTWGSVCNYNFDIEDASVACRQMGLVLNPYDWRLEQFEIPTSAPSEQIQMSNVKCTDWDTDITKCEAELGEDIENSCAQTEMVGMKCYDTAWAGIRLSPSATKGVMKFAVVEKAGLLDPHTSEHKPAIQLDFSHHVLSDVRVSDNTGDGLGVIYSDIYFPDAVNYIDRSEFSRNLGNGVLLRQLGLKLRGCTVEHNKGAGILHDPAILRAHQREIAGWITTGKKDKIEYLPMVARDLWLSEDEYKFIITLPAAEVNEVYNVVARDQNYVISIQLMNPFHNESTEEMWIYDRHDIPAKEGVEYFPDLEIWSVKRDQVTFPTISSSYGITLWYKSGSKPRGNLILQVRAIRAPEVHDRYSRSCLRNCVKGPLPKLELQDTHIRYNGRGIAAIHYNRYENEDGDLYLRKANESIEALRCEISFNQGEAFHVFAPYREIYQSNISEITFMINSSVISDNSKAIFQYSKDLRSANNLFHWILRDNIIERNKEGGFQVALPYVWQYNENYTHSVHFENVTFVHNSNFEVHIDGHYSKVIVVDSNFANNDCKHGVFTLSGMEKQIMIFNNRFLSNKAAHVVQFNVDSQSDISGQVQAYFVRNQVKLNTLPYGYQKEQYGYRRILNNATYQPESFVIGLRGVQKVNITNNLFGDNSLDYELVAGIKTARLDNYLNVVKNWWGTADPMRIKEKIFDFDDWNSYGIALYRPFFLQDNFDSPISTTFETENEVTLDHLAGRLLHPLVLYYRPEPYIVKSDLTIMPNSMLSIAPGVVLEFYPSVGILALGPLIAQGDPDSPIIMRPITVQKREELESRPRMRYEDGASSVRLCIEDECEPGANEGFLEYYNKTTLQWIPMCDNRFTERNVQVVCRELGFDHMNVFLDFDIRLEYLYNFNYGNRIRQWPEPFQCVGDEKTLDDCPIRMNGQLYGYDYPCYGTDKFVFINCGERNLDRTMEYWGGIRFSVPDFEQHLFEHRMHDIVTHNSYEKEESIMEFVNIYGAGILHNEKSPAILSIMQSPIIRYVNITKSASHGISIISAPRTLRFDRNFVWDNMGVGFTGVSLTGEAQDSTSSSFFPLKHIEIPYGLFGLIDICDTNKEIIVEERVVVYYKYDNHPVDCVKIFTSVYQSKNLGFRLLQLNLYNSTGKPWAPDYIKLIDGDVYNITSEEIVTISMNESYSNKFYQTSWPSLSVKLHATGATEYHGFVAEILTLPVSPHGLERDIQHNITYTEFLNNTLGGVYYGSAGEISPMVTFERNRFENNCRQFYGNFSTCRSGIRFDVQNMRYIYFMNNVVRYNQGGIHILADSSGSATSLKAFIYNNVFENNTNREVLYVEGKRSSPFQEVVFYRNFVTRNNASYRDVVTLTQVVSNLTENYFSMNYGKHIMDVTGFDKVRLPIYQSCTHNSFYMNSAVYLEEKATIVAGSTGQQYIDNIFVNPANAYELVTVNKSRPRAVSWTEKEQLDRQMSAVDARHNWWGFSETIPVMGKIRDENDNIDLLRVLFLPFRETNRTLLSGKCPPSYFLVSNTCYIYVGGYMSFNEAKEFCKRENATVPYVDPNYYAVVHFIRSQQEDYDYYDRVWVQDIDRFGSCTVFVRGEVVREDCDYKLPFICETDPSVRIDPLTWTNDTVTIGAFVAGVLALVLIIFLLVFCYTKSATRKEERLERRNSVRASMRSSRSLTSMASFSDPAYRRRVAEIISSQKSMATLPDSTLNNYPKMNGHNGSVDSFDKTPSHFHSIDTSSYDLYDTQTHRSSSEFEDPLGGGGYISRQPMGIGIGRPRPIPYSANGLPPPPPQVPKSHVRNVRADVTPTKPHSFDLTFQNQNFRETPSVGEGSQHEYWGDSTGANLNGTPGFTKYKNTNVSNDFLRSASMATASTFPLQATSTDDLSDDNTPPPHQPYLPPTLPLQQLSKSYDQLQMDQNRYPPPRPSLPLNVYGEVVPHSSKGDYEKQSLHPSQSQPMMLQSPPELEEKRLPMPPPPPPPKPSPPEMISFGESSPRTYPRGFGPETRGRVIETSLDDLEDDATVELDYNLDETITRPVSTYLETNVDSGDVLLPPIRNAKSQYIPTAASRASRTPAGHQGQASREEEFQALTSRSKSMPLETEM